MIAPLILYGQSKLHGCGENTLSLRPVLAWHQLLKQLPLFQSVTPQFVVVHSEVAVDSVCLWYCCRDSFQHTWAHTHIHTPFINDSTSFLSWAHVAAWLWAGGNEPGPRAILTRKGRNGRSFLWPHPLSLPKSPACSSWNTSGLGQPSSSAISAETVLLSTLTGWPLTLTRVPS